MEWAFQLRGMIKAENDRHGKKGEVKSTDEWINPENYRITDDIEYYLDLFTYDSDSDTWVPLQKNDVQLEFIMLDPYYRIALTQKDKKSPQYSTSFKVPDKLGIYKFKVYYKRYGWSTLDHETKVVLRQYRHNEFERYLPVAYPYYAGVLISLAGFLVFSLTFMYSSFK